MDIDEKLSRAIRALKIDVPVTRYDELVNGGIRLYLYGGRILDWKEGESIPKKQKRIKNNDSERSDEAIEIASPETPILKKIPRRRSEK